MINTPLYLRPDPTAVAAELGYNQADTAMLVEFAQRGYVVLDLEFEDFDQEAANIINGLEAEYDDEGRLQDAWQRHPSVKNLATHPRILDALGLLYGRDTFPFQTLNFSKGTEQQTHSDTIHFDSSPRGFMAGVWIALEDIDTNNGPLHYYPGSHKLPQLTLADADALGSDLDDDAYKTIYEPMIAEYLKLHSCCCPLKA